MLLAERVLVWTGWQWGLGEEGTNWGCVWEIALAGCSGGLGVGVREGEQSRGRCLGGWPERLGAWQLWEMTGVGTDLEPRGIREVHLGRILFEILIHMVTSSKVLNVATWSFRMGPGLKVKIQKSFG